ncbi:glutathione synthase [Phreatobacter oligotrophus]|jgi:glutathione synthase|uniref:glutathione synthase n=1 Tax=Phreatobacter oligotrophus TaxID=1122261 RepID=UPI00235489E1|nr:glutathione synthase [Phreatobacter oligotrophus]MBX9992849.1 glutathione synthase [Phreatobacter oligotrophus]
MSLKVAIQTDPLASIKIRGDSGFALMLEAQARGHALHYYHPDSLAMRDGEPTALVHPVTVRDVEGDHFTLGEGARQRLDAFDVILMRQDPPFDLHYITATHFLERVHPRTLVVNDPTSVRNAPEKIFVTRFPQLMPKTLVTRDFDAIRAFRKEVGDIVMKPLYGHGGAGVFRIREGDENFGSFLDTFAALTREPWVIQHYLPAVRDGDKRIILVDGVFAGAVNRVPAADDLRSNMVRGGAAETTMLTPREREICETIGPDLKAQGIILAGIDVIGGNLTEINVTAPTGIRAIRRLGGPDIAATVWEAIERRR